MKKKRTGMCDKYCRIVDLLVLISSIIEKDVFVEIQL